MSDFGFSFVVNRRPEMEREKRAWLDLSVRIERDLERKAKNADHRERGNVSSSH